MNFYLPLRYRERKTCLKPSEFSFERKGPVRTLGSKPTGLHLCLPRHVRPQIESHFWKCLPRARISSPRVDHVRKFSSLQSSAAIMPLPLEYRFRDELTFARSKRGVEKITRNDFISSGTIARERARDVIYDNLH